MLGFDHGAFANDNRALQHVAQFAYITRPRVVVADVHDRFADHGDVAAVPLVDVGHERFDQIAKVLLVIAKRRNLDVEHVEAVIEVAAQFALGDGFFGNLVGGGNNAHVDRGFDFASESAQLAIFEDAQQLGLRADRHFADLVEKQRAAFGEFKAADATLESSGESSLFVTKDFAFDQRFRNRRAVDGHECTRFSRAVFVNGACDQFLAGTAFSGD